MKKCKRNIVISYLYIIIKIGVCWVWRPDLNKIDSIVIYDRNAQLFDKTLLRFGGVFCFYYYYWMVYILDTFIFCWLRKYWTYIEIFCLSVFSTLNIPKNCMNKKHKNLQNAIIEIKYYINSNLITIVKKKI